MTITTQIEWKSAELAPSDIRLPVIYCTAKGKVGVLKDTLAKITGNPTPVSKWEWLSEKYNIKWWVYSDELTYSHS